MKYPGNPAASKIQNKEILGIDVCKDEGGCAGCSYGCGKKREKVATIWYIIAAAVIILASLGLKALGIF
jgi:hypothetical protein